MRDHDLNILVIDEDPARAAVLEEALVSAGYSHVVTIQSTTNLRTRVAALCPDMIIIDLQNPDRKKLDDLFEVTRQVQKPIAMFVDQSDGETTRRAMEAGVSAYVVDGLKGERVHAVVDVAINRF
ncbi:MAG: ANTAR domain-containing response regulator, partial [Kordiimonas sp.]